MAFLSLVDLSGTAGQSNFTFAFPYLAREHIYVYLDGVETTAFSFNSDFVVHLTTPLSIAQTVRIQRVTPADAPLVDFVNGATLGETDLDASVLQVLYVMQEATDIQSIDIARSVRVPLSDTDGISELGDEASRASRFLYFDLNGNPTTNAIVGSTFITFTPTTEVFSGDAIETTFTLASPPGAASALIVSLTGVLQRPAADFTVSGSDLIFSSPPPVGTSNIVVQQFGIAQSVDTVPGGGVLDGAAINVIAGGGGSTVRTLGSRFADVYNGLDHGLDNTGATDCADALNALGAIPGAKVIYLPAGTYRVNKAVTFALDYTRLVGAGPRLTTINFQPTASNVACFTFWSGGTLNVDSRAFCGIDGFQFSSAGNTQVGKIALQIKGQEQFTAVNCSIASWTDPTFSCVGIKHFGWQLNVFKNWFIYADLPLWCLQNSSTEQFLDLDFCTFENILYGHDTTHGAPTQPCVRFADGLFVSNTSFKNSDFVRGAHGIEWIDVPRTITAVTNGGPGSRIRVTAPAHGFPSLYSTQSPSGHPVQIYDIVGATQANGRWLAVYIDANTFDLRTTGGADVTTTVTAYVSGGKAYESPGNSYMLTFDNMRAESRSDTTKYNFYFDRQGSPIDSISLRDCYFDSLSHGFYGRNITHLSLSSCVVSSTTKIALNLLCASNSSASLYLENTRMPTSGTPLAQLAGYRQVWGTEEFLSAGPLPTSGLYVADTGNLGGVTRLDNTQVRYYRGTIEDDGHVLFNAGTSVSCTISHVIISALVGTTFAAATAFVDATGGGAPTLVATTGSVVNTDTDTNLCIQYASPFIRIKNRLGSTCTYMAEVFSRPSGTISATNLSAAQVFVPGTPLGVPLNLTDIVITDSAAAMTGVKAELRMSNTSAGTISVVASGDARPVFSTGLWSVSGSVSDVNACLAAAIYTPADGYNTNFSLYTSVWSCANWDGAHGTKLMTV